MKLILQNDSTSILEAAKKLENESAKLYQKVQKKDFKDEEDARRQKKDMWQKITSLENDFKKARVELQKEIAEFEKIAEICKGYEHDMNGFSL